MNDGTMFLLFFLQVSLLSSFTGPCLKWIFGIVFWPFGRRTNNANPMKILTYDNAHIADFPREKSWKAQM